MRIVVSHCALIGTLALLIHARRWKRQALPFDNVQVFSFDSNVTVANEVKVISKESRIEIAEPRYLGRHWSTSSSLVFDATKGFATLLAQNVTSHMNISSAKIHSSASSLNLTKNTNRNGNHESRIDMVLTDNVTLDYTEANTNAQIRLSEGQYVNTTANTWNMSMAPQFTLSSAILAQTERSLTLSSIGNDYNVIIFARRANVAIFYGNVKIDIDNSFREVVLTTEKFRIQINTVYSPFDVSITNESLDIRSTTENTYITLLPNSTDVNFFVGQLSKLSVNKITNNSITLQNVTLPANSIELDSKQMNMHVQEASISALANYSRLVMQTDVSRVTLTASHHAIEMPSDNPHLLLSTGNISVAIDPNTASVPSIDMALDFAEPPDKFSSVGPFEINSTELGTTPQSSTAGGTTQQTTPSVTSSTQTNTIPSSSASSTEREAAEIIENNPSTQAASGNTDFQIVTPAPHATDVPNDVYNTPSLPLFDQSPETLFPSVAPETTTDNFVIGQFGSRETPDNQLVSILATISNVALNANTTEPSLSEDTETVVVTLQTPLRFVRHSEAESQLQVKLLTDSNTALNEKTLTDVEALINEMSASAMTKRRKTREIEEPPVFKVDSMDKIPDSDALMLIRFHVEDNSTDLESLIGAINMNFADYAADVNSSTYRIVLPVEYLYNMREATTDILLVIWALVCLLIVMALLLVKLRRVYYAFKYKTEPAEPTSSNTDPA